jgi:type VI secretion system secreted protein Hcp
LERRGSRLDPNQSLSISSPQQCPLGPIGLARRGQHGNRAELSDLSFSKLADLSSPILLQTCAAGKTMAKISMSTIRRIMGSCTA